MPPREGALLRASGRLKSILCKELPFGIAMLALALKIILNGVEFLIANNS